MTTSVSSSLKFPLLFLLLQFSLLLAPSTSFNLFSQFTRVETVDGNLIPSVSETINILPKEQPSLLPFHPSSIKFNTSFVSRKHPYVIPIPGQRTTACAAKFRSLSSRTINMWWEDGKGGLFQGTLQPGQESTTNTYEGHVFFFTDSKNKQDVISRIVITKDMTLYPIEDTQFPVANNEILEQTRAEVEFNKEYVQKNNGVQWRHYYGPHGPRPPPTLYMLPAEQVGQQHTVTTPYNHW
jgi:hypothetical protein